MTGDSRPAAPAVPGPVDAETLTLVREAIREAMVGPSGYQRALAALRDAQPIQLRQAAALMASLLGRPDEFVLHEDEWQEIAPS